MANILFCHEWCSVVWPNGGSGFCGELDLSSGQDNLYRCIYSYICVIGNGFQFNNVHCAT